MPYPSRRFRTAALASALTLTAFLDSVFAAVPALHLNEVESLNQTGLADDAGARSDWIELRNAGSTEVALAGWSLSDDRDRPRQWTFLDGAIPAGGYLIVYASGADRQPLPAPPLEPAAVPGLRVWLRADAIRATDPGQVRTSGGTRFVTRWPDATGLGRDARQTDPARQPRLATGAVPAVRFDGTDDLLLLAESPATNSFTILAVVKAVAGHEIDEVSSSGVGGTSGQHWLFGAAHGGDAGAGAGLSVGTNGVTVYEHGSGYMPALAAYSGPLADGPFVLSMVYSRGRPALAVKGHAPTPGEASVRNTITAPAEIGSGAYGSWAGEVFEILVFDRALEEAERRGLEVGLATRHRLRLEAAYHTNFRLAAEGEFLSLTRPDGTTADAWEIPPLPRDISWGPVSAGGADRFYFFDPSPGAPNQGATADAFLAPPAFSVSAGFHTGPVSVAITAPDPDAQIRFTLDGSEPTASSLLYAAPVVVTNRTAQRNDISAIPTAPGWQAPLSQVFKGTVLRARAFRSGAIPSDVATASYFVDPTGRKRYSLPVVSLATAPRNFFDPEIGIYVPGNSPSGNYAQSGDAWERPVHVEFFETNGVRVLAQESGVRIHGNTSFGFPLKALRLHPENQRGTGPFQYRIFPDLPVETFHRLLLRPSGHDYYLTMMRDGLMQSMVRELGLDMQGYRPAIVFLNGEYWGIHNLQEAFEKHYFHSHHPEVDAEAVDYLEGYAPGAYAYEGDPTAYHDLVRFLETHTLDQPGAWDFVRSRMEVDNFRDYKLAEILYYRWDIGNHRLWRPHTPEGRLRWILFDCDVGYGGFWSVANPWAFDMLSATLDPTGSLQGHNNGTTVFLLRTLVGHPEFRRDFINRAADLMNGTLSTPRMLAFIDRFSREISPEISEHIRRWRAPGSLSEWQRNVENLRTFARLRPGFLRQHFIQRFGLGGTVNLRLGASVNDAGTIRCGSLELAPTPDTPWEGVYFRNHPLPIEARPKPGWRFVRWQGLSALAGPMVTLSLASDIAVTAEFARVESPRLASVTRAANGQLVFGFTATPSATLEAETSPDLVHWSTLGTVTCDARGAAQMTVAPEGAVRFLRLR